MPDEKKLPEAIAKDPNVIAAKSVADAQKERDEKIKSDREKDKSKWPHFELASFIHFRAKDAEHAHKFAEDFKKKHDDLDKSEHPNFGVSTELFVKNADGPGSRSSVPTNDGAPKAMATHDSVPARVDETLKPGQTGKPENKEYGMPDPAGSEDKKAFEKDVKEGKV